MLRAIVTLLISIASVHTVEYHIIKPASYRVLTESATVRHLPFAFDNNGDHQSLIHVGKNERITILVDFEVEQLINKVEVILDVPEQWKQSIRIGYVKDKSDFTASMALACQLNKTATVCRPPCDDEDASSDRLRGIVGTSLIWTIESVGEQPWCRIYDMFIYGTPFEKQVVVFNKVADISLLKPYRDHDISESVESSCPVSMLKLIDTSGGNSNLAPVTDKSQEMTIYFGKRYSVTQFSVIVSKESASVNSIVLHFGGVQSVTKTVDLDGSCSSQEASSDIRICPLDDLVDSPFENVTLDIRGLVKLHFFGMPFYYPRVALIPSSKSVDPDGKTHLQLKCQALPCGVNPASQEEALVEKQTSEACVRYGRNVRCQNMELLRFPSVEGKQEGTVLISDGSVVENIAKIMTELDVVRSSDAELVARIPRTYHYYGQYSCRCITDDASKSLIQSPQSRFNATEFDQDLVFQRNYSAIYEEKLIESKFGFLEFPTHDQGAYFALLISGHLLLPNVQLKAEFTESGQIATVTGMYATVTSVEAFPKAIGAENAWPISAYQVKLQDAWPDLLDASPITITWKTDANVSTRMVKDTVRVIVVSPARDGSLRAWLWQRTERVLDIRAYLQLGTNIEGLELSKTVYMQRSNCSSTEHLERIGAAKLTANQCTVEGSGKEVTCHETDFGFVIQFLIQNPSASDAYSVYAKDEAEEDATVLVHSEAEEKHLSAAIDSAEINLIVSEIVSVTDSEHFELTLTPEITPKIILDSSACRPVELKLVSGWNQESSVIRLSKKANRFSIKVPKNLEVLDFDTEITVQSSDETGQTVQAMKSLQIINPILYKLSLEVDSESRIVSWSKLPDSTSGLVDSFQVDVVSTIKACGKQSPIATVTVDSNARSDGIHRFSLPDTKHHKGLLVDYNITVVPKFKSTAASDPVLGQAVYATFSDGSLEETEVSVIGPPETEMAKVYVKPSQLVANCLADDSLRVNFDLQVVGEVTEKPDYIRHAVFELQSMDDNGLLYAIKSLLPGRRYKLQATVVYSTGVQDQPSKYEHFHTTDDVSISLSEVFISPGERVEVNCTGKVGPELESSKYLEWKRVGGYQLPEGTRSVQRKHEGSEATVSLVIDHVEKGQTGLYACYIVPSVDSFVGSQGNPPTVKIVVTGLKLNVQSKSVSLGDEMKVRCISESSSDLQWTSPDKTVLKHKEESEEGTPFVQKINDDTLELTVPSATLNLTGEYTCSEVGGQTTRVFDLRLKEDVNTERMETSSDISGKQIRLKCKAKLGFMGQNIHWYLRKSSSNRWREVSNAFNQDPAYQISTAQSENELESQLHLTNSPDTNGEIACRLRSDPTEELKTELTELTGTFSTIQNELKPELTIGEVARSDSGEIHVPCLGYPATETDSLRWLYGVKDVTVQIGKTGAAQDEEIASLARRSFHLGDRTPATWPGSEGPSLLIASNMIIAMSNEKQGMTPERLELILPQEAETEKLEDGYLVCEYAQRSVPLSEEQEEGKSNADSTDVLAKKEIPMKQILDGDSASITEASSKKEQLPRKRSSAYSCPISWNLLITASFILNNYLWFFRFL